MEQVLTKLLQKNKDRLLFECRLVAYPGPEICEKIRDRLQSIRRSVEAGDPMQEPVIEIAGFVAAEPIEETLMRWLQRICSQQKSFMVTLNNFGGLPPRSVCLRVMDHGPFNELATKLSVIDPFLVSNGGLPLQTVRQPHLSIAQYQPGVVFTRALFEYSKNYFHGSFMVSRLVLLKSEQASDPGTRINIFSLLPMAQEHSYMSN
jgi:2'-5' RNA ligase